MIQVVASGTDSVCLLFCEGSIRFMSLQERLSSITGPDGLPAEQGSSAQQGTRPGPTPSYKCALGHLASLHLSSLTYKIRKNFFYRVVLGLNEVMH